jgi:siroheme synthase-like protein
VYPICLVAGAGSVAARKVRGLLAASARITVVALQANEEIRSLAAAGKIAWLKKPYAPGDLQGFHLAIAATSSAEVNTQVFEEAEGLGIPVNSVDDPRHSSFFVPAVLRRGLLTLAISTSGAAPYLARRLREHLEGWFYPELAEDLEELQAARGRLIGDAPGRKAELIEQELEPRVRAILSKLGRR